MVYHILLGKSKFFVKSMNLYFTTFKLLFSLESRNFSPLYLRSIPGTIELVNYPSS